jgi:crossover junction endodeoxyribonuclease RuvC
VVFGVVRTPPADPVPSRLAALEQELDALLRELSPRAVVVERVLFQANTRTAMSVGQASGVALLVAARAGIPVTEYSPNEVKLAVTGYGGADKAQVQAMVARLLALREAPKVPDAADALALAITHLGAAPVRATVSAGAPAASSRLEAAIAAAVARDARR